MFLGFDVLFGLLVDFFGLPVGFELFSQGIQRFEIRILLGLVLGGKKWLGIGIGILVLFFWFLGDFRLFLVGFGLLVSILSFGLSFLLCLFFLGN
jgi:hypothetical protein